MVVKNLVLKKHQIQGKNLYLIFSYIQYRSCEGRKQIISKSPVHIPNYGLLNRMTM